MQIEVKTITPEVAAIMLTDNPENRNVRRQHVEDMARDMKAGRWQVNGDAIRLNADGSLIDGQHRLHACVAAGVPFETLVVSGLPDDVRATIDGGKKRTHGDRLAMRGVPNATTVSAACRLLFAIAHGKGRNAEVTSQELDAILAANPGIIDAAQVAGKAFMGLWVVLPAILHIGIETGHGRKASEFVEVFKTGVPAYKGCPAHLLRERIIKHSGELTRYSNEDLLRAAIAVWRHFVAGNPISQIRLVSDTRIPGWTPARLGL